MAQILTPTDFSRTRRERPGVSVDMKGDMRASRIPDDVDRGSDPLVLRGDQTLANGETDEAGDVVDVEALHEPGAMGLVTPED